MKLSILSYFFQNVNSFKLGYCRETPFRSWGKVWGMSHYSQIQLIHRLKDGGGTRHDYRWA